MDSIYKMTSQVENFFSMLLTKAGISKNLFIGSMPATVDRDWKDMVLVDVLSMRDYDAYAQGSANVFLYAKSMNSRGTKPVKALYKMELALDRAIKKCNDRHYAIDVNFRDADYDQNRNYYYNVINIQVTIK